MDSINFGKHVHRHTTAELKRKKILSEHLNDLKKQKQQNYKKKKELYEVCK